MVKNVIGIEKLKAEYGKVCPSAKSDTNWEVENRSIYQTNKCHH